MLMILRVIITALEMINWQLDMGWGQSTKTKLLFFQFPAYYLNKVSPCFLQVQEVQADYY